MAENRVALGADPARALELYRAADQRLRDSMNRLDDAACAAPSTLPGWSRAHVLTHLARNADAHTRRMAGALRGEDVPKYRGGAHQRAAEIAAGTGRGVGEIVADLVSSHDAFLDTCDRWLAAGAPDVDHHGAPFLGQGSYPVTACPAHRLREVEMHHVDLAVGYTPLRWDPEYVGWELPALLASAPQRTTAAGQAQLLAWLAGRDTADRLPLLEPWG